MRMGLNPAPRLVIISAAAAVILCAKLYLIALLGSDTPFWDQWEAEGARLYVPYFAGTLSIEHWFAVHNEHRILFTRILAMASLLAGGDWSPVRQTIINATLHVFALFMIVVWLSRGLGLMTTIVLSAIVATMFSVPFAWMNTVIGFQSQFYFLVLFGCSSSYLIGRHEAWSPLWWLGALFGIASYLSLSSGALTLLAAALISGLQLGLAQREGAREYAAIAFLVAACAVMTLDVINATPAGSSLHPSPSQFGAAIIRILSWPVPVQGVLKQTIAASAIYAPAALALLTVIRRRAPLGDPIWTCLAFAAWVTLQAGAIAFGRPNAPIQPHYLDIYLIGLLANAACLLHLATNSAHRVRATLAAASWTGVVLYYGAHVALNNLPSEIETRRATARAQAENLSRFLATGDPSHLRNKPVFEIPYPDAERLREIATDPAIRAILRNGS
jgi:hypothetical protein